MIKKLVTVLLAITLIMSVAAIVEAEQFEKLALMNDISISGPTVNIPPIPPVIIPPVPPVIIPPVPPVIIPPVPPQGNNQPPSAEAIAFADRTSDHLTNMLVA